MGKASKWMISFLLGKKDEKEMKRKERSFSGEYVTNTSTAIVPSSSVFKRRWSFGKSTKKSKSLDIEKEKPKNKDSAVVTAKMSINTRVYVVAVAAATKIQTAFRSYLARRALYALRGLVKLQALVRGHLVRKQTTSTLRQMHALMAIQVRARFQRIQMVDQERHLVTKSKSSWHGYFNKHRGYKTDHNKTERALRGNTKYYSGELSLITKKEPQYDYEQFRFTTTSHNNSPRNRHSTISKLTNYEQSYYNTNSPFRDHPNYMVNTESSRSRVRSQSEPKQRPISTKKPNTKQYVSKDGRNSRQHTPSQSKRIDEDNEDPWLIKLYQSTRPVKDMGMTVMISGGVKIVHRGGRIVAGVGGDI